MEYGGEVLVAGIEDRAENYTRFHLVTRGDATLDPTDASLQGVNKMSLAFAVEHRPGTLVAALQGLATAGVDLTKIESRPVPGSPWEYVFYVDVRFTDLERRIGVERVAGILPDGEGFGDIRGSVMGWQGRVISR